jgi:hypothetical protein
MKALVLAVAVAAALSSSALAGAARDTHPLPDTTTAVLADAGRIGSASLTAFNGSHWSPAQQQAEGDAQFDRLVTDLDTGTLLIGLSVIGFLLSRPLTRALRRQELQRRAAALAATLPRR